MKKNTMLRIASVLLVAVMMTTCAISGTFAKYVTSETGSDSARGAKWGVAIVANGSAFGTTYKSADGTISTSYNASTDSVHNNGGVDTKKLVAPGTNGSVVKMAISGKPEVDVEVKFTATVTLTGWTVDSNDYFPIIINVGSETYGLNNIGYTLNHGYDTVAELKAGLQTAINGYTANYEANTDLSSATLPSITWNWPYYTSADNDVKDTALGNQAAVGNAAEITITIVTTVTQID